MFTGLPAFIQAMLSFIFGLIPLPNRKQKWTLVADIARRIDKGETDDEIKTAVAAKYGLTPEQIQAIIDAIMTILPVILQLISLFGGG